MLGYRKKKEKATKSVLEKNQKNKRKKTGKKIQSFQIRLMKDLEELDPLFKDNIRFKDPKKMDKLELQLKPASGLWEGNAHEFEVNIPKEYPIKPPRCICKTKLWHPNFNKEGHPCLNILREDWKPVLTLNTVFIGLHFLFLEPNPVSFSLFSTSYCFSKNDPLNEEAADQYEKNFGQFKRKAKNYMSGRYSWY